MRFGFLLISLWLTACASTPHADLDEVRSGMDKDQVLQKVGNPKRTFRASGQDHWIYVYFQDGQEVARQIDFADGKVVKVGRPVNKNSLERQLENSESMEEYESKARAHQRKSSKFKDVDGG